MLPKVFIITLNWNGKDNTEECLNSLQEIYYGNYKTVVVDNGSDDGSVEYLKNKFLDVHFMANKRNTGFAEGNNIGVKYAISQGADYVLLLNNDTVVDKDFLKELVKTAENNKDAVIIGPKIYNYYYKTQIESAGYTQSILTSKTYPVGYKEIDHGQYEKEKEVNFISGCAMLIKKSILKDYVVFDSSFFAYCEDQDLCYSVVESGKKILYSPKAKIWHKVSASTGGYKSPISVYLFTRNRIKFVLKRGNFIQKAVFFSFFFFYYLPAYTIYSLLKHRDTLPVFYKAVFSFVFYPFRWYEFEHRPGKLRVGINARYIQRRITGIEKYIMQGILGLGKIDKYNEYLLYLCKSPNYLGLDLSHNFKEYFTDFPTKSTFARIIWEQFFLSREIRKNKIHLFHGTSFVLPLFKPCKYVLSIYDLSYLYYPESYTFFSKLYYKIFLPHSIKKANKIITISNAAKNEIMAEFKVPDKKIEIIYPAFDDIFKPVDKFNAKNIIKRKYGLDVPFFIFVGSLIPRKNIVRIILAFDKIKDSCEHKLVIIGKKGWLYDEIFNTVKRLNLKDKVIFTEYVPEQDLPLFYNAAEALVFASLHEGFGIPILEAMACGCPVITSNKSSMPEVAGNGAILVDPLDINSILEGMRKIIDDEKLRKTLIANGFERIKHFSWQKSAEQLLNVYEKV